MQQLKMGIIGAGLAWERLHFPAYDRLKDRYTITAICDTDIKKAQKACDMVHIPHTNAYDAVNKMLHSAEIDAVDIMVPIAENYNVSKEVMSAGKHVIAEKPLASTIASAKELIKLGKKLKVMVAENYRYDEENNIIKQLLNDHAIGNPMYFFDNNISEFTKDMLQDTFAAKEWRQHPDFKGGIFTDSAVHHIARQRFLFGDVIGIFASGRHSDVDFSPYSCINAMLTYNNSVSGHYVFCCIAKETQAPLVGLRIFGTHGEIYLEDKNCGFLNLSLKTGEHQVITYKPNEGYYNELVNFHEAVVSDRQIVSTPEKELGDIQVIMDILKSIEQNAEVSASNNYRKLKRA